MPSPRPLLARLRALLILPAFTLLCGCDMVVLNPPATSPVNRAIW